MRRRHVTALQRERHRLGTLRRLWRAVEEFSPAGWGHDQLSALALLAANVDDETPPWRAVERLARRTAAARWAAIDRLGDIALELGRCDRREEAARMTRLTARIERALADLSGRIGRGGPFSEPAGELARAAREALSAVSELRSGLVGRVAVDLTPLLRWLSTDHYGAAVSAGRLAVDLSAVEDSRDPCVVLAGVLDLADGLGAAFDVLLGCPRRRVCAASLSALPAPDSVSLRIDWRTEPSGADPAPAVLSALLPLEAYGGILQRLDFHEPTAGGVAVDLRLAASGARRRPVRLVPTRAAR